MEMSMNTNDKTNLDENNQGCAISFEVNTISCINKYDQ